MKITIGVEQEPSVQFTIEVDDLANLPDLIKLPDGSALVHHGRYASPGNCFSYRRISKEMTFCGEIKPWKQYTELVG